MPNRFAYRQMALVPTAGVNVAIATRRLVAGTVVVDTGRGFRVNPSGLLARSVLEREDVLALAPHHERSECRHDMLAEHDVAVGGGRGVGVYIDMFTQIPLDQVGHRGRRTIRLPRLAGPEPRDESGSLLEDDIAMSAAMAEMAPVRVGDLEVARVEEMIWTVSPRYLYAGIENERFEPYRDWLQPHFSAEDFKWRLSIHTFVVRSPHHTIIVDTCVGNDRNRSLPVWNRMRTDYPERLAAAGVVPEEVDYVFCTHMHVDHVGWNTRLDSGRFVPTFPNAKYLFHRTEWEHWKETEEEIQAEVVKDSLLPIVDAGLAEMVEDGHVIEDGVRLLPTPGHTPGHCSLVLGEKEDGDAVITGDLIHHPFLVAEPDWPSRVCWDPEMAVRTRRAFVERYADTATRVLGTHFAPPTAVHIESGPAGCRVTF